jgi:copper transport protein
MRGAALLAAAVLAAVFAALAGASAAQAHASLVRSEPPDRAVVAQPPADVKLTFNEPVSPLVLRLVRPNGELVELKGAAAGETIVVTLPPGSLPGTHLLSWRVISADGHPVGGALTFSIGQPSAVPAPLPAGVDIRLRGAIWLARLVLYLGLFIGVGGAFYSSWIAVERRSDGGRRAISGALACGLVAALVSVGLHGVDALGVPLSNLRETAVWGSGLATAYGLTLCIAVIALVLGLAAMSAAAPVALWCSALALIGVGAALAASGHAATAAPELATRPAVFLHGMGVAFWLGALIPLATALCAGEGRAELARFSKIILWPVVALVASGVVLAVVQVRQVEALWTTSYGVVLSCKIAAVCVLLALAAFNRRLTPRAVAGDAQSIGRIGRSIWAEVIIVALILGLVACWRFTPPPRALQVTASQPIYSHIHTERAMADLQIEPVRSDGRSVVVTLLDGQFSPLAAKEVTLVLAKPDAGIEPLRMAAQNVEATIWRVDAIRLPMGGRWRVRLEILVSDFEKIALEDEIDLAR